jgi:hypothetical protein
LRNFKQDNGALIASNQDEDMRNVITIVDMFWILHMNQEYKMDVPEDSFSSFFILESLIENQLQDLNEYRFSGLHFA